MIGTETLTVHTEWIEPGGFFIRAIDEENYPFDSITLKSVLFGWHEKSYYGTFIETVERNRQEGLFLSPSIALDFFAQPAPLQHINLHWSKEAKELLTIAPLVKKAIAEGLFQPDFTKWQAGKKGWKLLVPVKNPPTFLDQWIDALLTGLIVETPAVYNIWADLHHAYPLLQSDIEGRENWTEEDWLIAIGWMQDDTPFRTCLQLVEPEDSEHWTLNILLQDRNHHDQLFSCTEQGKPIGIHYPEHWRTSLARLEKDIQKISDILPWLKGTANGTLQHELSDEQAWTFLTEGSLQLIKSGFTVFLPSWWEQMKKTKPRLKASIKSSVGSAAQSMFGIQQMMQFDWKLAIGDITLSEEEFSDIIARKKHLIQIRGKWIQLDATSLAQIQAILKQVNKNKGLTFRDVLEAHLLQPEDEAGNEVRMEVEINKPLRKMLTQLQQTSTIPLLPPPDSLQGTLRPYQVEGVSWLGFLRRFGLGACLADDMGLGKTLQFISYLLHVKETENYNTPALLICPTSVLGNWQKEIQRFAPSLKVYLHYGSSRKKGKDFLSAIQHADIVLTSYTLSHMDEEELQSVEWNAICLDEAQNIKNAYTKQSRAIRKLNGKHRIALTGTPIENRLTELWSIFDFINPNYLGTLREFTHRFVGPIEKTNDTVLTEQLQKFVRPFLLRRVKRDPKIQLDLPDKYETKEFVSLTVEQASLYETIIQDMFATLEHTSPMERRGLILSTLTKLKQVCNHPALFLKEGKDSTWASRSNKIERLLAMIDEIRQKGERCLLFTQFVEMGHLLQTILEQELREPVYFLHGGTPKEKRDEMVARFQDDTLPPKQQCGIFILSLKAGGTGLNLTAANHVFHFDRWWNPAVENQATDRTYRIGQTRHVQVHKFVTLGTLEERIDEIIEKKQQLSEQVVGSGETWITEMTTDELRELFSLRKEWIEK
jgi:SNF2 family DNA or RNA helicase